MKPARILGAVVLLALAAPASARAAYREARIRHVEPQVLVQRATEASTEEAIRNLPFLPGDRVWTERAGRVEFQFFEGSLLRLDRRSKLDFVARETSREGEVAVLQLWSGSLYLRVRNAEPAAFEIDTPDTRILVSEPGLYRIDTWGGETRLLALEGRASLETGRERIRVAAGEQVFARSGDPVGLPEPAPASENDEFADWNAGRESGGAWAAAGSAYLPLEAAVYAEDLEGYGTWYYEGEIGYVWRPFVAAGWRPYGSGHWIWTAYGWTWVPYEPWGWVPFHYGRWGYSGSLGWYWAPRSGWGPAWVGWGYGSGWVGWCPLGPHGRPIRPLPSPHRERAVPRGGAVPAASWVFARENDLGYRERARWRTAPEGAGVALRALDTTEALDRELRVVQRERARALVRPGIGGGATAPTRTAPAAGTAFESRRVAPRAGGETRDEQARRPAAVERGGLRTGSRGSVMRELFATPRTEAEPRADLSERRARPGEVASPEAERQGRTRDTGRDVLRRFFAPLSRPGDASDRVVTPRPDGSDSRVRSQPRSRDQGSSGRAGGVRSAPRSRGDSGATGVRSAPRGDSPRAAPRRETSGNKQRERSKPRPPER